MVVDSQLGRFDELCHAPQVQLAIEGATENDALLASAQICNALLGKT